MVVVPLAMPVHTEHRAPLEARQIQNVKRAVQGSHALLVTTRKRVQAAKQPTSAPLVRPDHTPVMWLANGGNHATLLGLMMTVAVMIVRTLIANLTSIGLCVMQEVQSRSPIHVMLVLFQPVVRANFSNLAS